MEAEEEEEDELIPLNRNVFFNVPSDLFYHSDQYTLNFSSLEASEKTGRLTHESEKGGGNNVLDGWT